MAERNVLILGKVGTGKKSLGYHIVGEGGFRSVNVSGADCHYKQRKIEDVLYRILTVNTESLGTGYFDLQTYINGRFNTIHLIIFVTSNDRYTEESHKSLMLAVQSLDSQAKSLSALVITHCEGIKDKTRQHIVDYFKGDPHGSKVADFIGKGIFTVGFPNMSKVSCCKKKSTYQSGIAKDKNAIKQLVENCKQPRTVHDIRLSYSHYCWRRTCGYCNSVCCYCSRCLAVFFFPYYSFVYFWRLICCSSKCLAAVLFCIVTVLGVTIRYIHRSCMWFAHAAALSLSLLL